MENKDGAGDVKRKSDWHTSQQDPLWPTSQQFLTEDLEGRSVLCIEALVRLESPQKA